MRGGGEGLDRLAAAAAAAAALLQSCTRPSSHVSCRGGRTVYVPLFIALSTAKKQHSDDLFTLMHTTQRLSPPLSLFLPFFSPSLTVL